MNFPRPCILKIVIDTPLNAVFDYRWQCEPENRPQAGQLALVPFAHREVVGLIVGLAEDSDVPVDKLKDALAVRSQLSPLPPQWLALAGFAADYYQRPLGEVALPGQIGGGTEEEATKGSSVYVPTDKKEDTQLQYAIRLINGEETNPAYPPKSDQQQ